MIYRIVELSLKHRVVVLVATLALAAWGGWAVFRTPVDAIPDLSDNQVIVFTEWTGRSPQEVEDQITYPLTTSLQGLAGVRVVRSQSAFGFSMIYVVFHDDIDLYFARARVLERLNLVTGRLPDGVVPTMGPDATGVGHIFWYTIESDRHTLRELRTIQDWFVRYQLNAVPGVAEVAGVGGHIQQYQVDVNPDRLRQYGLTLGDVVRAVQASNSNVGGNVIESSGAWSIVRGVGLLESTADLESIVLRASAGTAVSIRDVAVVKVGDGFRVSTLVKGDQEAVGGVIVARAGTNTREVIEAVKARIDAIEPALPPGVRIVPFYDRSQLIDRAIDTLRVTLLEEILFVALAHVVFLRHVRSILIVTIPLPLAVLASFLLMYYGGITSNIMSLAGIAIAIGVLVDAGIVVTENAFRTIERQGIDPRDRAAVRRGVLESVKLVARPVVASLAIILLAFLPVLVLTGQEGKLFGPLAWTKTFAVFAATVLAVTTVPVLCSFLLGGRMHREEDNAVMRALHRIYSPALDFALRRPLPVLAVAALLFAGAAALATRIGSEFMPALNEGDFLFMPIADPAVSLDEATEIAKRQNAALLTVPEVASVVAKVARADTSTDPAPLNMTETVVSLKPPDEWRPGQTLASLRAEMSRATQLPGVTNIWTMPIINRIDMLTTGVRSELGVKLHGPDLSELEAIAARAAEVLRTVPGAANVYPEQLTGAQYLNVTIDRAAAARYGVSVADIQQVVDTAIGETIATTVIAGRQRIPVRVRYASPHRDSPAAIASALVSTPAGPVPLSAVARVGSTRGPTMIAAEDGLMVVTVLLNVSGRDTMSFVDEAKARLADEIAMPAGSFMEWSGQYQHQASARARLLVVLPIVFAVILLLLYLTYRSWLEALHVLLAVPFALTGGVLLLYLSGYNFSVAVWVGFIALFGTAVQTGMLMVLYLQDAVDRARERIGGGQLTDGQLRAAVVEGALLRLRPKVMTTSTVVISLLPIFMTSRVGSEVLKPLATPVLGGMVSSLLHVLVITPVIFFALHRRKSKTSEENLGGKPRRFSSEVLVIVVLATAALVAGLWLVRDRLPGMTGRPAMAEVLSVTVDGVIVRVLADGPGPKLGRSRILVTFEDAASGTPIDAGVVTSTGTMTMPGMPMTANVAVRRLPGTGRYEVDGEYSMAGTWTFTLEWRGPRGPARATFDLEVH